MGRGRRKKTKEANRGQVTGPTWRSTLQACWGPTGHPGTDQKGKA